MATAVVVAASWRGTGAPAASGHRPWSVPAAPPPVQAAVPRLDTGALQAAIDRIKRDCSPSASYDRLSLITLPAGVLDVSRQISVDATTS
ncbi:hypothetical protein [Amycolatopsis australiensis]|uniref:hypothetical protein n=1 Tax=Amycolatopsis australiensis TaxID=546364 RepID=UPI0009316191|nr:hypothetical protein [Amycolatopsis australiensis]